MSPEMVDLAKKRAAANDTSKLDRMKDDLRNLRECPPCQVSYDASEIKEMLRRGA